MSFSFRPLPGPYRSSSEAQAVHKVPHLLNHCRGGLSLPEAVSFWDAAGMCCRAGRGLRCIIFTRCRFCLAIAARRSCSFLLKGNAPLPPAPYKPQSCICKMRRL